MRLRLSGERRSWSKYAAELLIVAAGVALGLWATEWAEDRQARSQVNDAYDVLSDELGDNLEAVRYREAVRPCVRRRVADLRGWLQARGDRSPLPANMGTPGNRLILDSVWDVSKSGQVVAKMPLETRRRYAALYDLFENFASLQRLERDVWLSLGDYGGVPQLTPVERARLNGLVSRAEFYDQALSNTVPTILSDLAKLKVELPSQPLDMASVRQRTICQPLASQGSASRS